MCVFAAGAWQPGPFSVPGSVSMDMRVNLALPGDLTDVEERGGEAQEPCKLFLA